MRVLHLISSGGMYGAEAVILQLCQNHPAIVGEGESSLAVFEHGTIPALHHVAGERSVRSELIACRGQLDRSVPQALRAAAARSGTDLIHAHGYKADIYAALAFRGAQRPALVSTCHTWYDNDLAVRVYGAVDRWVLRGFEEVVAVSAEVRERLVSAGVAPERISTVRNGIDTRRFETIAAARRPQQTEPLTVGLVGRLAQEKGVDLFLRAAAVLQPKWPAVRFVVAGEGPERAALEGLRAELGLAQSVELAGALGDMAAFYAGIDVMVSASRQEGLPMALLEGMSAALPVVATTVGEVPSVVVDGETGLLVPPNDPEALAAAIGTLLASPELRSRLGAGGRRRAQEVFSAERMTSDYVRVYRRALERRGPAAKGVRELTRA